MKKTLVVLLVVTLSLTATLTAIPTYAQPTTIRIDPPSIIVTECEEFTVNIDVADVEDLFQWWIVITFDNTLVRCISLEEGPFLKQGGTTYWGGGTPRISNDVGMVIGVLSLYGLVDGVDGSGTLAYIKFRCLGQGDTDLHFDLVALSDSYGSGILENRFDGYVQQLAPDSDGDGLSDCKELTGWDVVYYPCVMEDPPYPSDMPTWGYHVTSDPNVADADGDRLNDAQEREGWDVRVAHPFGRSISYHVWSDPNVADNDGDGKDDYTEWLHRTDPNKGDSDCDGAYDTNDGFEIDHGLDPLHFDSDRDGIWDGEEIDLWLEAGYSLEEAVAKTKGRDEVGGVWLPIDKLELLAPYIGLASLIAVATVSVVYVKYRKKKTT